MMTCRMDDLRDKEVVNLENGARLGCVCDIEMDTASARVCALVVYGRPRFFGLLGREDDLVIRWDDIEVVGDDIILVRCRGCSRVRRVRPWKRFLREK